MKAVRAVALGAAGLGAALVTLLLTRGGFDADLFGRHITTHDPVRPALGVCAALAVFVLAGGTLRWPWGMPAVLARGWMSDRSLALLLAAIVLAAGLGFATMAIGGSDSYGYVSQADLWRTGNLKVPQPWVKNVPWPNAKWTFTPLGYRPAEGDGQWDLLPSYSPGLPLLMAAATTVGGEFAKFAVVPILGAVMVWATFGIGCRLGSSRTGLIAALLVATSPVFLFMLMLPMSDVAAAGVWTAACYYLLGPRLRSAAAAGALSAVAILIRPNLFLLAAPMGGWYLIRAWQQEGQARRLALAQFAAFGIGVLPGVVAIAAINQWLFGSPGTSGYGRFGDQFSWAHVWPNSGLYARWFVDSQSPLALIGLAALVVPWTRVWPSLPHRSVLLIAVLFVFVVLGEYFAFIQLDTWWSLRLLLPAWPFMMLGLAAVALASVRSDRPLLALFGVSLVVVLSMRGLVYARDHDAFSSWKGDRRYPAADTLVRDVVEPNSLVLSLMHSGSLRYYAGCMTMRFDILAPDGLDEALAWLTARGVHPYALLETWELAELKRRFRTQRAVALFDAPPVFVYSQAGMISLYDLWRRPDSREPTRLVEETFTGPRLVAPAPPPVLTFKDPK